MPEDMTTIQVSKRDAETIKRLMPHLKSDAYRVRELLAKYQVVGAGVIPAPAGSDPEVHGIPYVEVKPC